MAKFTIHYNVNRVRITDPTRNTKRVDASEGKHLTVNANDYGEAWATVVAKECQGGLKNLNEVEVNDPKSIAHGDGVLLTQIGFSREQ